MNFNSQDFDLFRRNFKNAVKELETQFDVKISMGNINYNDSQFTTKMTVVKGTVVKLQVENPEKAFIRDARGYGFIEEDFGKTVKLVDGTPAKIVGFKPRSNKYPLIVEELGGKRRKYKMSARVAVAQLRK